jgi:hypothetical protein
MADDADSKSRCYTVHDGEGAKIGYLCGALGPACFHCGDVADALCDFPLGEEGRTCDRPLCLRCAPEVGADKNFCREHNERGPGLLLFRRKKTQAELMNEARGGVVLEHRSQVPPPRPPTPPRDKRWRAIVEARAAGDGVWRLKAASVWCDEIDAAATVAYLKRGEHDLKLAGNERALVQTWPAFLADFRKRWPAERRPRLDKEPPPDRRWRVWQAAYKAGGACVLTGWMDQISAEAHARRIDGRVETWDAYVEWFRKRWPRKT